MGEVRGFIDLHIHSKYSDGHFGVKEVIDKAQKNNTNFIAICDHDSIKALKELSSYLLDNMYSTTSVEFSSYLILNGEKIMLHLLGYGFDPSNIELNNLLIELKKRRLYIHNQFLKELKSNFAGLPYDEIDKLNIERYCWFDRDVLACIKENINDPIILSLITNYFKNHKLSYGIDYPLNVEKVIDVINKSGGISVLAHPMAYNLSYDKIKTIIKKLVELGLRGIETFQSDCNQNDSIKLLQETERYKLLYSVGSDFHREINSDNREIGKGINENLCISSTSVSDYLLEKNLILKREIRNKNKENL